ncbi:MAG TPA: roadblock/LC7 domain-containing protein [Gemmatimonadaceae bacterium]|nr:roadblock/LC7 domain-containing protein [Gemmatimonadaceae bacterium]
MSDDVRRLSDELARDPGSRVFVPLGEALRRQGQRELALKVTMRGLERHPHYPDGHDLLARIAADGGDLQRAFDEWDMVLRLVPGHHGALRGLGFVCFQQGRLPEAEQYLTAASAAGDTDEGIALALANVRSARRATATPAAVAAVPDARREVRLPPGTTHDPRFLFADVLSDAEQTAMLLNADGLVLAGAYVAYDGRDVAQEVGAELSGVTDAARRATRHLQLGEWTSIVFETEVAVVAMAPSQGDGLLVLATSRTTPLGLVRRLLDRCTERSLKWLGGRI